MRRFVPVCILVAVLSTFLTPVARAAPTEEELKAEGRVLKLINEYRVNKGLAPVVSNAAVKREARRHNNYQANQGTLSHDGFAARTQRIADEDSGIDPDEICENVASAQGYDELGPVAVRVVRAWKTVKEKRRCMLDRPFTKQSAGVAVKHAGDTWYVTYLAAHDTTP
jgi:uncharacterized protein YkwD